MYNCFFYLWNLSGMEYNRRVNQNEGRRLAMRNTLFIRIVTTEGLHV
jgi:hypothetical protein